jgi:alpha-L-glutamate ligase-like protein
MLNRFRKIRREFVGINNRNVGFIFPSNPRKFYKMADDKVLAKKIMEDNGILCAETFAVIEKIGEIPNTWSSLKHHKKLVIKPANGSGGNGILILSKKNGTWISKGEIKSTEQIYLYLANIIMGVYSLGTSDRVLIEECIVPHDCFHKIYPEGVADLRVIVFKNEIALAMLLVPTDKSDGKANLHKGGLGIGVNLDTGKMTHGFDGKSYFSSHPDSKSPIMDLEIPFWQDVVKLSLKTAEHFPLQYLGVDIVIDIEKGPMVMEVNVRPGLGIQMVNRIGLKPILERINQKK